MELTTTYSSDNYTIYVATHILDQVLPRYTTQYENVFYIIDSYVHLLYEDKFRNLENVILVPRGESFKTIEATMAVVDQLLESNIKRNDLLVVIGGGATGDGGAFIASITLRGVNYLHIPTTLLAHDSAIGGKTAVNRPSGKNLVGTFYRPKAVIYDLDFLKTLPMEEVLSGFGEIIKHAMLDSEVSISKLMEKTEKGIQIDALNDFILNGIKTKMYYVTVDETEQNLRRFLNLGHTLGHALEYAFKLKHGHAVVLGIVAALYISEDKHPGTFNVQAFTKYAINLGYDISPLREMNINEVMNYMNRDKKNKKRDFIGYVILKDYGNPEFIEISIKELESLLNEIKVVI